jgi:hypothetical protein
MTWIMSGAITSGSVSEDSHWTAAADGSFQGGHCKQRDAAECHR